MTNSRWPDTTTVDKPKNDSPWGAAQWLVGRHPMLQGLLARVPDVISWEEDYEHGQSVPWVEVENLKAAINALDAYMAAWTAYKDRTYEPKDEARWGVWESAGPKAEDFAAPGVVHELAVMSGTELARLRLLATVGNERVLFATGDLWGFDAEGHRFIADWCSLVMAQ